MRRESYICAWLALVLHLFITRTNSELVARDKNPGFISIDCGSNTISLDDDTGFLYQADEEFVETGENRLVSSGVDLNYPPFGKLLNTLRIFPKGERNCYMLKPEQGENNRYLIRATFAYGNYDGKNETQSFDLYIGGSFLSNITMEAGTRNNDGYTTREIIYTPPYSTDTINICLVKTGSTIPFISVLELRPLLNNSIYPIHQITTENPPPLLLCDLRIDVSLPPPPPGSNKSGKIRYKDDAYDRLWRSDPYYNVSGWHPLETQIDIEDASAYKLPPQVLKSAAQSPNVSSYLRFNENEVFYVEELDRRYEYYTLFHFAEIEQLPDGKRRIININLNSKPARSQGLVLEYLKPVSVDAQTVGSVVFSVSPTPESDAPPILNAFEIYKLLTLDSPTHPPDVSAILGIKTVYQIYSRNWQGDPCLPNKYAWEGLVCSPNRVNDTTPRITSLNLSSSKLTGEIDISFSYLKELKFLDLSNNAFTGPLPKFLADLPKLQVLNLTGNKLSGPIPKALKENAALQLQLSVADNPDLCMKDSCERKNFVLPLVASFSALIVILLISLGLWIFRRPEAVPFDSSKSSLKSKYRAFSYTEILNITDNLNLKNIIGEGGFGKVYFGTLQDHTEVAVKLLSRTSKQGYKEFLSEVQLLMTVHHRHLVCLVGYCDEGEIKALIYEYMAKGDLQQHLSLENPNALNWNERLNIAVEAAQGLDYLHNGCKPPLVHRDLKTSNILLDQNMHAKIADFGLCRAFGNDVDSHISTRPAGTPGYVDPEFHRTGNLNKNSDIYSFGIILFELITGQKVLVREHEKNIHILQRVIPIIERGDIQNTVDPRLQGEFSINSAWKAVEIGMSCISPAVAERPDISQILAELKECFSLEMMAQRNSERGRTKVESSTSMQIETETVPLAR